MVFLLIAFELYFSDYFQLDSAVFNVMSYVYSTKCILKFSLKLIDKNYYSNGVQWLASLRELHIIKDKIDVLYCNFYLPYLFQILFKLYEIFIFLIKWTCFFCDSYKQARKEKRLLNKTFVTNISFVNFSFYIQRYLLTVIRAAMNGVKLFLLN